MMQSLRDSFSRMAPTEEEHGNGGGGKWASRGRPQGPRRDRKAIDAASSVGDPETSAVVLLIFVVSWLPNSLAPVGCGSAALGLCGANCIETAELPLHEPS